MSGQGRFAGFVLLGVMRSGSNLLERYLNQYDGLICHGEVFNPSFVGQSGQDSLLGVDRARRNADPLALVALMQSAAPGQLVGFRYFPDHDPQVLAALLPDPAWAKIVLRRDPLESFVSLRIARRTGQWLIADETHRKSLAIDLDLTAFAEYRAGLAQYYAHIENTLRDTGQQAFVIDYAELSDPDRVNALADFLGAAPRATLDQPIKRQNPQPLWDKILNYDQVAEALGLPPRPDRRTTAPRAAAETASFSEPVRREQDVSLPQLGPGRLWLMPGHRLAFAPVPGVAEGRVSRWMQGAGGQAPFAPDEAALAQWLVHCDGPPLVLTVITHPLLRAYRVFLRRILATGPGAFGRIRAYLGHELGVLLPPPGAFEQPDQAGILARAGYGPQDHATAFAQFLGFVGANLQGATEMRVDGHWRAQVGFVDAYADVLPPSLILREHRLARDLPALAARLGLSAPGAAQPRAPDSHDLAALLSGRAAALSRAAHGVDYQRYGWPDLTPAHLDGAVLR